jgi:osmotically-inducible protein OsmY
MAENEERSRAAGQGRQGAAPRRRAAGTYRGVGPRGYRRSPERIYEDICDRLAENPFIDASDIEVSVSGSEVTLSGAVDSVIALRQVAEIADEVAGVSHVHNHLSVRQSGPDAGSPGGRVNRALGSGPGR